MSMMKDSKLPDEFLREVMTKNPPSVVAANGNIFSGPVRLSFVNLFTVGKPGDDGQEGKYGCALLFPPGTDMRVFEKAWHDKARESFPNNWTPDGKPVNLHSPFHDQAEKAYGAKPLAGYTPGAMFLNVSSKYRPAIVDQNRQPVSDERKVYAGVWAYLALNTYSYKPQNKKASKTGVGFGIQSVMILADDDKLTGGGGNPQADFGAVQITATSNVAAKFGDVPGAAAPPASAGIMPQGGHVGQAGNLPTQALPTETDEERLARELMG